MSLSYKDVISDPAKMKRITKAAFETVDTDKSGYLEREELEVVMANVARDIGVDKPTKEEVDEMIIELDDNSDGRISLTEFQVLIEQVLSVMAQAEEDTDL